MKKLARISYNKHTFVSPTHIKSETVSKITFVDTDGDIE